MRVLRIAAFLVLASFAIQAGPLNVVTYPVRHPLKTQKAVATGLYKAVKALVW